MSASSADRCPADYHAVLRHAEELGREESSPSWTWIGFRSRPLYVRIGVGILAALLIVPALWTTVTTFKRVQAAQKLTGQTAINGWLGLVLYLVISPAMYAYMQSGLNGVWKAQAGESASEG